MKPRLNTGIRYLIGKGRHIRPAMSHPWSSWAGNRNLRNVFGSERRLDDARDSTAGDAMGTRKFGMHWRIVDWLPRRLAISRGVVVDIAIANGRDWAPEIVMIFGIEHGDVSVVQTNRHQGHEPRAIENAHLLGGHESTNKRMVGIWACHKPKTSGLRLFCCSLCADFSTIFFDLI